MFKKLLAWFVLWCVLSAFGMEKVDFRAKNLMAGKALLTENGYQLSRQLGTANFSPELRLPIQLVYNSALEKSGIFGFAWFSQCRHYHCKNNRKSEKMKQFWRLFLICGFAIAAVLYSASCASTFSLHPLTQENTAVSFPIELCGKWNLVHRDGSTQHIIIQIHQNKKCKSTYQVNIIQKDVCIAQLEGNLEKIAGKYYVSLSLAKHKWQAFNLTKAESFLVLPVYVTFYLLPNEENVKVYSITLKKGSQPNYFFKYSPSDVNDLYAGNAGDFRNLTINGKQNYLFTYEGVMKKHHDKSTDAANK